MQKVITVIFPSPRITNRISQILKMLELVFHHQKNISWEKRNLTNFAKRNLCEKNLISSQENIFELEKMEKERFNQFWKEELMEKI